MNNFKDTEGVAEALKGMKNISGDGKYEQPQCKTIEGFANINTPKMSPSYSPGPVLQANLNKGKRYYNYVQKEQN